MSAATQISAAQAQTALRAQQTSARRFSVLMAALAVTLTAFDLVVARLAHVGTKDYFLGPLYSLVLLAFALWYCRSRPLPRLVDACESGIWIVVFTNVLSVLIQLAARSPYPLVDQELARLDARMHFATASAVAIAARMPALRISLTLSYAMSGPLMIVAVLLPAMCGHINASRRYMLGIVLAGILTASAFAIWPAAGPWTTEGYAPAKEQAVVT
jgi:heme/copper-type cytochrome/quinol oxidase subunit 4